MIIPLKSQDKSSGSVLPNAPMLIGRVSLISPKLVMEIAPHEKFTLTTGFWVRPSFYKENSRGQQVYDPTIAPSFTIEPRYYFNLEDRKAKGKRTEYYSGWYVGMPFNIEFPDFKFIWGGNIGFQCIMGKRWYWNISTGPGFVFDGSSYNFTGVGDFGLGIILN